MACDAKEVIEILIKESDRYKSRKHSDAIEKYKQVLSGLLADTAVGGNTPTQEVGDSVEHTTTKKNQYESVGTKDKFDIKLHKKMEAVLKKLYPNIKLNYTTESIKYTDANGNIMNQQEVDNKVKVGLKVVEVLDDLGSIKPAKHNGTSQPVLSTIRLSKKLGITKKLAAKGVSKGQIEFMFEFMEQNNINEISSKDLAERVMFGLVQNIEINTAVISNAEQITSLDQFLDAAHLDNSGADPLVTENIRNWIAGEGVDTEFETFLKEDLAPILPAEAFDRIANRVKSKVEGTGAPTNYYKQLTVPGGTNYKEIEISTPNVKAARKGHAEFTTDKGIGWYRVDDDEKRTDTLRVLEMQSDMFQKMKGNSLEYSKEVHYIQDTIATIKEDIREVKNSLKRTKNTERLKLLGKKLKSFNEALHINEKELESLMQKETPDTVKAMHQMLNTDNKWVKFFIQSIVQDAQKKGYKKIKFPSGETAAKVEGHDSIAEQINQLEDGINNPSKYYNYNGVHSLKYGTTELTTEDLTNKEFSDALKIERDELKTQGIEKLAPIEGFYQVRVRNTLMKTYGRENVKTVTDEHGNTWFEVTLDANRDSNTIMLQQGNGEILGQADMKAETVLINSLLQRQDTLPHEYAHHYINMFRDAPIVKEAIKKWGSEEALVQAIGEQVVKQKGEAYGWWKKFSKWVQSKFTGFNKMEKEELKNVLTDAFLNKYNLNAINTRKDANYQLNELFLDTVLPRYNSKGLSSDLDEFIGYTSSVFPTSELQDIYKHDTNINHSTSMPSDYEVASSINSIEKDMRVKLKAISANHAKGVTDILAEYNKFKSKHRAPIEEKVPNYRGIVVVKSRNLITKKSVLGQLDGYQTVPGQIEYIDTNTMETHIMDVSKLNDYDNFSYEERMELEKKYANKLKATNIIIKQIIRGGMLGKDSIFYAADADNPFIKAQYNVIKNLQAKGFSIDNSYPGIDFYQIPSIVDSIMLSKGIEEIANQKDIMEYLLKSLSNNPLLYNVLEDLEDVLPSTKELYSSFEKDLKPLKQEIAYKLHKTKEENAKWMYHEGFNSKAKGRNYNVGKLGFFFGEVGQATWGYGNTSFLAKLDVNSKEDGAFRNISNLTGEFIAKNDQYPKEAVVYTPEQIHVFGSEKDIKMFKEWKHNNNNLNATKPGDSLNDTPLTAEQLISIKKANDVYREKYPDMFSEGKEFRYYPDTNKITVVKPTADNGITKEMYEVYTAHEIRHAITYEYLNSPKGAKDIVFINNAIRKAYKELEPGRDMGLHILMDRLKYAVEEQANDINTAAEVVAILSAEPSVRESFLSVFPQKTKSRLEKILDAIKKFIGMETKQDLVPLIDSIVKAGKIAKSSGKSLGAYTQLGDRFKGAEDTYERIYMNGKGNKDNASKGTQMDADEGIAGGLASELNALKIRALNGTSGKGPVVKVLRGFKDSIEVMYPKAKKSIKMPLAKFNIGEKEYSRMYEKYNSLGASSFDGLSTEEIVALKTVHQAVKQGPFDAAKNKGNKVIITTVGVLANARAIITDANKCKK